MGFGGTRAAEIVLWVAAVGVGIAAVVVEGVASRTSLVVSATLLALAPVLIEIFRRRHFAKSGPAQDARTLADEEWNSTMRSRINIDEPHDPTIHPGGN